MTTPDLTAAARLERVEQAVTELILALDGLKKTDQGKKSDISRTTNLAVMNAAGLMGIKLPSAEGNGLSDDLSWG